jgi:cardiolipin synthase
VLLHEMSTLSYAALGLLIHFGLQAAFIVRALLRPNREPSSRVAWVLVILAIPALGMVAYLLFGETNIGRKRVARYRAIGGIVSDVREGEAGYEAVDPDYRHIFRAGQSISGFPPVAGNRAEVLADSNAGIDALVADMDRAERDIHLLFYIWLSDNNGTKVSDAAIRAAKRGVAVRAMADDVGSRALIRSPRWAEMEAAGVRVVRALPASNPLLHPIRGRFDLRNHRKIAVIDGRVTYCGSQNCADPEFRVKPKYAPWVDILARYEGPVVRQNQTLFAEDWMAHVDEDLSPLLKTVPEAFKGGFVAQAVGTGPTVRAQAMPELFEVLIHAAREELVITTPYFVPSESLQSALLAAGHRGVRTTIVFPERNDSWIVAAASRSYYPELLEAGIRVFEYRGGLLHAKTLTLDGRVCMIGSANLDRRSFDLNYENNILNQSEALTAAVRARQDVYIAASREVTAAEVAAWSAGRRLWNNAVAMFGPIL